MDGKELFECRKRAVGPGSWFYYFMIQARKTRMV